MQYPGPNGNITYSSLLIANITWPGSYTVYRQGEFSFIYIGNCIRSNGLNYFPLSPGLILEDPYEKKEFNEPNPDKEPEIIESDTDKEDNMDGNMDD